MNYRNTSQIIGLIAGAFVPTFIFTAYPHAVPTSLLDALAFHAMAFAPILFAYVGAAHGAEKYSNWLMQRRIDKIKNNP